ncbi:hypothetical protein MTO96_051782 [Rhipicephalus appendiculatus]
MEVDEVPPGPSRASENHENDASSVSPKVGSSNEARASSDASLDTEKDGDAGLSRTWTEDGWHTVLSRRRKKNSKKSQKETDKGLEKNNEEPPGIPPVDAAGECQAKRDFQRRKRRGPTPLPKEDIKVIPRPHKGLTVKKSTRIGALYGSNRGLPEQFWRRQLFTAGPSGIEHRNLVHAT